MEVIDFILKKLPELLNGNFDLSKILNLNSLGAFSELIKPLFSKKENPTDFSVGNGYGLTPVATFADRDIVIALNRHLGD